MSEWIVAAIPEENDYVWKISSEKVPHMTLLYLGEQGDDLENPDVQHIVDFIQHVTDVSLYEFGLSVDHRGTLGPDDADVLFFEKGYATGKVNEFRQNLLRDPKIFEAYSSADQYEEWTPHLTLGYPTAPAHEDDRDYPGIRWVNFNKIALWTGDSEGPEFRLDSQYALDDQVAWSEESSNFLEHFGVKGMKWGVRTRSDGTKSGAPRAKGEPSEDAANAKATRTKIKTKGLDSLSNKELQDYVTRLNLEQQYANLNQKQKSAGEKFAQDILKDVGKDIAKTAAKDAAKAGVNAALKAAGVSYKIGKK